MKKYLFGVFVAIALIGCGISPKERLAEHNIILEDDDIMDDFKIVSVASKDREDGLKEAQAVLKNDTKKNRQIAYKVDWIDENGFVRDSILSKWKVVEVEAGRNVVIEGISPNSSISDFKIRLNYPSKDDKFRKNPAHFEYQGK